MRSADVGRLSEPSVLLGSGRAAVLVPGPAQGHGTRWTVGRPRHWHRNPGATRKNRLCAMQSVLRDCYAALASLCSFLGPTLSVSLPQMSNLLGWAASARTASGQCKTLLKRRIFSIRQGCIFGWICWTLDWRDEAERAALTVKEARGVEVDAPEAATDPDLP